MIVIGSILAIWSAWDLVGGFRTGTMTIGGSPFAAGWHEDRGIYSFCLAINLLFLAAGLFLVFG